MKSFGLLALRLTTGGLLMGHGAQKLWGSFNGPGPIGTAGWLESLDLKPGPFWAQVAGWSEFGGGLLTALGFMHPVGPVVSMAPMLMAATTAHKGKPIWVAEGGAELPLVNMAAMTALTFTGSGKIALDAILGTRLGWKTTILLFAGVGYGLSQAMGKQPQQMLQDAQSTATEAVHAVREQVAA